MYQTIRVSSCLSIQGEFVETLATGQVVVRDGRKTYRGEPIRMAKTSYAASLAPTVEHCSISGRKPV